MRELDHLSRSEVGLEAKFSEFFLVWIGIVQMGPKTTQMIIYYYLMINEKTNMNHSSTTLFCSFE